MDENLKNLALGLVVVNDQKYVLESQVEDKKGDFASVKYIHTGVHPFSVEECQREEAFRRALTKLVETIPENDTADNSENLFFSGIPYRANLGDVSSKQKHVFDNKKLERDEYKNFRDNDDKAKQGAQVEEDSDDDDDDDDDEVMMMTTMMMMMRR
jgi:hypothetical protein